MDFVILSFFHIALGSDNYVGGAVFGLRVANQSEKVRYYFRSEFTRAEELATEATILL
jgi:hypothetical protein